MNLSPFPHSFSISSFSVHFLIHSPFPLLHFLILYPFSRFLDARMQQDVQPCLVHYALPIMKLVNNCSSCNLRSPYLPTVCLWSHNILLVFYFHFRLRLHNLHLYWFQEMALTIFLINDLSHLSCGLLVTSAEVAELYVDMWYVSNVSCLLLIIKHKFIWKIYMYMKSGLPILLKNTSNYLLLDIFDLKRITPH